jgi:hypothetical protein
METSFYINQEKLPDLKSFIRENTPSVRFLTNPIKVSSEYQINISMNVEDGNKISQFREILLNQEREMLNTKRGLFKRLFGLK